MKSVASTALAVALIGGAVQAERATVIAVLEHPQHCEPPDRIAVRALFAKSGGEWLALGNREHFDRAVPGEMRWTIAFAGRNLGALRTTAFRPNVPADWFDRDMLLELAPGQQPPRMANSKKQFEGWCEAPSGRPLVLVSGRSVRDPDEWKHFVPSPSLRKALFPRFRQVADTVYTCPTDSEKAVLFEYTWRNLKIVTGYRDRTGRTIVAVELDPRAWTCEFMRDPEWDVHWFLLGDQPVLLGRSLELVDVEDYDADGKSELLFWYSGHNEDGYTLFAADFQKRIDRWWHYH
jgi:hypothetical protein